MNMPALLTTVAALAIAGVAVAQEAPTPREVDIIRRGDDLPSPLAASGPRHHVVNLDTTEVIGQLEDGTS